MCTVSYVFQNGKVILTSNRDEKIIRPKAIQPKTYCINSKKIYFPKDPKAGGTWFAVSENGTVCVLLNGATEKHEPQLNYSTSRGLILLQIISQTEILEFWNALLLTEVEPFTLVLFYESRLHQLRWNGVEKTQLELDYTQNYIWSSATLYPKEVREQRQLWFENYMKNNVAASENDLLFFHEYTESNNKDNGLVINRKNELITQSITQTVIEKNKMTFLYKDLIAATLHQNTFLLL